MAIILEEKKSANWTLVLIVAVLFIAVIGGVYFLFFAETPGIEVIVPTEQEIDKRLSQISFDETILSSDAFKIIKKYPAASIPETTGRSNPFVKF